MDEASSQWAHNITNNRNRLRTMIQKLYMRYQNRSYSTDKESRHLELESTTSGDVNERAQPFILPAKQGLTQDGIDALIDRYGICSRSVLNEFYARKSCQRLPLCCSTLLSQCIAAKLSSVPDSSSIALPKCYFSRNICLLKFHYSMWQLNR